MPDAPKRGRPKKSESASTLAGGDTPELSGNSAPEA
jgi:hypothetical protein